MTSIRHRLTKVAGITAIAALALTGCAASTPAADAGEEGFGDITVQLSWLKNHEFAGFYYGIEDGHFAEEGFNDVELVAGGAGGVPAEAALASGSAWIGVSSPMDVANANAQGADLRIVGLLYQKNPFTLVSADSDPITTPSELVGKTIAIADTSASNWEAFLAANDIDPADVNRVPYGDAQTSLKLDQIDGFMGYGTGGAALRETGFGAQEFHLADYGLEYSGEALVVRNQTLQEEPAKLKAFLRAYAAGWQAAFNDVDRTIELVVDKYGKDQNFDPAQVRLDWDMQELLIITEESLEHGIATATDRLIDANVSTLALAGVEASVDELFDLSLIHEVYEENPDLIGIEQ